MSQENKAYIVQLVKQIVHPYFAGEIADILIAHGMTFKTEPQTKGDRIRAMPDEELAELLANETYRIAKPCFDAFGYGLEKQVIYAKRLDWLKQPAEGERS